ncbi:hypothetical protein PG993_007928 [Apiospora rasikravindrae]|uniref:Peptidase A1 domain-containing protein n=1 Tax=Apiospora rasikravindrae TaxID=990691 RepID=A0ABR1SZ88_9PEZI
MAPTTRYALVAAAALAHTAAAAGVIEMPITFRNSYAMVSVEVGTPGEEHFLRFDTGSASTWIVDKKCAQGACNNYSGFPRVGYSLDASSTGEQIGNSSSVDYLGGRIAGPSVRDTFRTGSGATWNQTFLNVNESSWAQIPGDGFLGLAFDTISDGATHTVPETLLREGALAAPRFGLYAGTELNDTNGKPGDGVLTLGGSREDKYVDGEMTWLPAMKGGSPAEYELWRAPLLKFSGSHKRSDGKPVSQGRDWEGQYKASGVFDTGAGTISVPNLDVYLMYQSIGWDFAAILSHDHTPLCSEFNSSWSVTFSFAGDGPDKYRDIVMTGDQLARPGFANRDDACWPPFEPGNNDGFFLFGTPLLDQFYTVYDFGGSKPEEYQPRIGFGQLKKEYKPKVLV